MMPDLGAYSVYVLSAYGVSLTAIVLLCLASLRRAAKVRQALAELEQRLKSTPS